MNDVIAISPAGASVAASWFGILPLILLGAGWLARRLQGQDRPRRGRRFRGRLLLLLLVGYYGVIWNWLYRDQFYGLALVSPSQWRVSYRMPQREASLDPAQIVRVHAENLNSLTGGATTGRIVIELADGRRMRSAQVGRHRLPGHVERLQGWLAGAAQGQ